MLQTMLLAVPTKFCDSMETKLKGKFLGMVSSTNRLKEAASNYI